MAKKITNRQRFAPKLKVKKGDKVLVTTGSYKGSEGEILEVFPRLNSAIVEGVNIKKRHTKPSADDQGGIIDKPAPVNISNLMLIDPSSSDPTKVGFRVEGGKIVRYAKKSGNTIA